jgi:hypothetical protein
LKRKRHTAQTTNFRLARLRPCPQKVQKGEASITTDLRGSGRHPATQCEDLRRWQGNLDRPASAAAEVPVFSTAADRRRESSVRRSHCSPSVRFAFWSAEGSDVPAWRVSSSPGQLRERRAITRGLAISSDELERSKFCARLAAVSVAGHYRCQPFVELQKSFFGNKRTHRYSPQYGYCQNVRRAVRTISSPRRIGADCTGGVVLLAARTGRSPPGVICDCKNVFSRPGHVQHPLFWSALHPVRTVKLLLS